MATDTSSAGWTVTAIGTDTYYSFTVQVPSSAFIATGYELRWNKAGSGLGRAHGSAFFDVVGDSLNPEVQSISLDPSTVAWRSTSTATVTLTAPAIDPGAAVQLSSGAPGVAAVPSFCAVATGSTTATFTVTTSRVSITQFATISATHAGVTRTAQLTVDPRGTGCQLASVTLAPASLIGGATSTGTVDLTAAAPSGGAVVALSSDNSSAAPPQNVTVPSGQTSATFAVITSAVATPVAATLTATYG